MEKQVFLRFPDRNRAVKIQSLEITSYNLDPLEDPYYFIRTLMFGYSKYVYYYYESKGIIFRLTFCNRWFLEDKPRGFSRDFEMILTDVDRKKDLVVKSCKIQVSKYEYFFSTYIILSREEFPWVKDGHYELKFFDPEGGYFMGEYDFYMKEEHDYEEMFKKYYNEQKEMEKER